MKNVDYKQIEKLIDYHRKLGNHNYFIGTYLFEKWSLSNKEKFILYDEIIQYLNNDEEIIIDISEAVSENCLDLIKYLNESSSNIYLSISIPIDKNFSSNEVDHLHHLNNIIAKISKEFYINITYNIVQFKKYRGMLKNIVKNDKVRGIIFNPDFFADDDIKYIVNGDFTNGDLNIIYNSDEFYLNALNNNNSIISKYINAFPEQYTEIKSHYKDNDLSAAIKLQEELNECILKLSNYGDLQAIKYILKINDIDLGGVRKPYYSLTEVEKKEVEELFLNKSIF
jgi:dihydrodipicolinate synthase/N-acetylneuraminate lyase